MKHEHRDTHPFSAVLSCHKIDTLRSDETNYDKELGRKKRKPKENRGDRMKKQDGCGVQRDRHTEHTPTASLFSKQNSTSSKKAEQILS